MTTPANEGIRMNWGTNPPSANRLEMVQVLTRFRNVSAAAA